MNFAAATEVLTCADRELWLVTAADRDRRGGLIATFVSRASIVRELPRVLVGIGKQHYSWELIESSGAFGLHLLGEQHLPWVWRFGLQSGRATDKFDGLTARPGMTGSPIMDEAGGWLDCRVESQLETGDRTVYLAEVVDACHPRAAPLLTVRRLLELAPANRRIELKRQMESDSLADAAAIREWRQRSRS